MKLSHLAAALALVAVAAGPAWAQTGKGGKPAPAPAPVPEPAPAPVVHDKIQWIENWEDAAKAAKAKGDSVVFVYVHRTAPA